MGTDYESLIDLSPARRLIDERGLKVKWLAEKIGVLPNRLSQMLQNNTFPKTDVIARMCAALKVYPSQIIDFKIDVDANKKRWFEEKALPYEPSSDATGELTYEPLRAMMNMYLDYLYDNTGKEKTVNDLLDMIEPYRRRCGIKGGGGKEASRAGVEARFGEGYVPKKKRNTVYVSKGLIPVTRTKLKNDRPLNIRIIYDICNFFGCSIDWVMSYK